MSVKQKMSVHEPKISAFRNKNKPAKSLHPAIHPGGSDLSAAIGAYYQTKNDSGVGFSVQSPTWISRQTYRWGNTTDGSLRVRHSDFSQDTTLRFAFGISYSGMERTLVGVDVRHYDFQHVGSLYDFSSNSKKRMATSLGTGAQFQSFPGIVVRAGDQFTDGNCNSFADLVFNTTLPIQRGHSIHFGLSFGYPAESWDITFSGSNSFGHQKIPLPDGNIVTANPNHSTFWWGLHVFF